MITGIQIAHNCRICQFGPIMAEMPAADHEQQFTAPSDALVQQQLICMRRQYEHDASALALFLLECPMGRWKACRFTAKRLQIANALPPKLVGEF